MTHFLHAFCLVALAAPFFLAACGTAAEFRDLAVVKGAVAADELLVTSELVVCRIAPVGSVVRRYGATPKLAEAWRTICLPDGEAVGLLFSAEEPE